MGQDEYKKTANFKTLEGFEKQFRLAETNNGEMYEAIEDDTVRYKAYLEYLELGNAYFKRICFEEGTDHFIAMVKEEYSIYHSVVSKAIKIAVDNQYSLNPLYFEMCKRKSLRCLGEIWQRQGNNTIEISRPLRKEFSFDDLQQSIGRLHVLLDFFYIHEQSNESDVSVNTRTYDINNLDCFAFIVHGEGEVQLCFIDGGKCLAERINDYNNSGDYFSEITNRVFSNIKDKSLIICADGDITRINIAALPYQKKYITDFFPVRNIMSVEDIVYPSVSFKVMI